MVVRAVLPTHHNQLILQFSSIFFLLLYCIRNSNDKLCPQISMGFFPSYTSIHILRPFPGCPKPFPSLFLKASCSRYPTPSLFFPAHFSSQRPHILNAWNRLQGENKSEVIDLKKKTRIAKRRFKLGCQFSRGRGWLRS